MSLQRLLFFIFVGSISVIAPAQAERPLPKDVEPHIRNFLEGMHRIGDAADSVSGGAVSAHGVVISASDLARSDLESYSPTYKASWWEVFGHILTAQAVMRDISEKDYEGAATTATNAVIMGLMQKNALGAGVATGTAYAGILGFALDAYFNKLVEMLNRNGIRNQMDRYAMARDEGSLHRDIMAARNADHINWDQDRRWFSRVHSQNRQRVAKQPSLLTLNAEEENRLRDAVFELARLQYEGGDYKRRLARDRAEAIAAFKKELAERYQVDPIDVTGTWTGQAFAGRHALDYRWEITRGSGDQIRGTVFMKLPDDESWSSYSFSGVFTGNRISITGTIWSAKTHDAFCMITGEGVVTRQVGGASMSGTWGPLDAPGGCPPRASGTFELSRTE